MPNSVDILVSLLVSVFVTGVFEAGTYLFSDYLYYAIAERKQHKEMAKRHVVPIYPKQEQEQIILDDRNLYMNGRMVRLTESEKEQLVHFMHSINEESAATVPSSWPTTLLVKLNKIGMVDLDNNVWTSDAIDYILSQ